MTGSLWLMRRMCLTALNELLACLSDEGSFVLRAD